MFRPKPYLWLFIVFLAVLPLIACRLSNRRDTATPVDGNLSPGDTTRTLTHEGRERSYVVHIPPGYDPNQPTPVVLVFHGGLGNAENAQHMTGFNARADAEGFIAVYPNGTGRLEEKLLTWNGGTCCGYAVEENVDDVGFVEALMEDLATIAKVNEERVYATGMSNGAIMSYRLACELSDVIAAIGPVAATQNVEQCEPGRPVPVIHFHGDGDQHAPYEGGVGPESLAGVDFASVETTINFWVEHNRCSAEPEVERVGNIEHTVYTGCDEEADVELYTVLGGLHAWPGGEAGWSGGDETTQEISATDLMWEFFKAHPMQETGK